MHKHLYFVCPSDNLESLIDRKFPQENYFLSSLGNSISFSSDFIEEVNALIESKGIEKITFVLSEDNKFVHDGIKNQDFDNINDLRKLYKNISDHKRLTSKIYREKNVQKLITSHLLKQKIKEMNLNLSDWLISKVNVDAKIYSRNNNVFNGVPNNLVEPNNVFLN